MSCLSEAAIVGWVEGRLADDDRQAAETHVLHCADCLELVAASRLLHSSAPATSPTLSTAGEARGDHPSPDKRYRIGAEIGAGGMGRVFESHDLTLGRQVAIKMVRDPSAALVARFHREVAIAATLQHPSIIPVYDAGTFSDGSAFCAMRLVEGFSLEMAIAAGKRVRDRLGLVRAVIAAADAMAYAHSRDIIHRDLKPQNIILGRFGETIVLDWGLAKKLGDDDVPARETGLRAQPGRTAVGDVVGTPAYMAPEQKRGEPADKRSDVFALGTILGQVVFGALRPIGELPLRGAPKELVAIIARATQSDADARYASAAELAEDLSRFETGQLVSARQYSRLSLLGRWARRRRGVLVPATLLVLLAGGALVSDSLISEAKKDAEVSKETERDAQLARGFLGLLSGDTREKEIAARQASATQLEQSAEADPTSVEAQEELARAYTDVGDARFRAVVGAKDHEGALASFNKALDIRKSLVARADPPSDSAAADLARTYDAIGDVYYDLYKLEDALAFYQRGAETSPAEARERRVARLRFELGDDDSALRYHQAVVDRLQSQRSSKPGDPDVLQDLSLAHGRVAAILASMGRELDARRSYQAAISTAEAVDYVRTEWKRALAAYQLGLGRLLARTKEADDARGAFARCAALYADFGFSTDDAFDAAGCSALAGDLEAAFRSLQAAVEGNWTNTMSLENNPDFASLRADPRWRSILTRMEARRSK